MDNTASDRDVWEERLHDPTAPPISLPFEFLKDITTNFSDEQELGRGGYGIVYKGHLRSGKIIAVKKLFEMHLIDDEQFQKEVTNLMGIKHKNIVQLVGYCAESRWEAVKLPGRPVMAQIPTRLLCFEYLRNKSLDKHVSDESSGLHWSRRYEIIKGICSGLHYLHGECHIVHLDLKPENILVDDKMTPKIADFGLSKLLGAQKSRTIISGNPVGSLGYMALEYLMQGVITPKADIFSLGVIIIEVITGGKEYPMSTIPYFQQSNEYGNRQSSEKSQQRYIEKVLAKWRNEFEKEPKHTSPEIYIEQVHQCISIALQCVDLDSTRRPDTCEIFRILTGEICSCQKTRLLRAQPFELHFNFMRKHVIRFALLYLTNNTDDVVAFRIVTNHRDKYFLWPLHGRVLPRSEYTLRVAMCLPPEDDNRFILELQSTIVGTRCQLPAVERFGSIMDYNRVFTNATNEGREVQQVKLRFFISREDDGKTKEPKEETLTLKTPIVCYDCVSRIQQNIAMFKCVKDVEIDADKGLVKVTSIADTTMLPAYLRDMLKRPIEVVTAGKENRGGGNDKEDEGSSDGDSEEDEGSSDCDDKEDERSGDGSGNYKEYKGSVDGGGNDKEDKCSGDGNNKEDKRSSDGSRNKEDEGSSDGGDKEDKRFSDGSRNDKDYKGSVDGGDNNKEVMRSVDCSSDDMETDGSGDGGSNAKKDEGSGDGGRNVKEDEGSGDGGDKEDGGSDKNYMYYYNAPATVIYEYPSTGYSYGYGYGNGYRCTYCMCPYRGAAVELKKCEIDEQLTGCSIM